MKNKYIRKPFVVLPLLFLLLSVVSCLDDKAYTDIVNGVGGDKSVIAINGSSTGLSLKTIGVKYLATPQDVALMTLTAAKSSEDVVVTMKLDPDYVDAYNETLADAAIAAGDTTDLGEAIYDPFYLLPDSTYTIPSLDVTIDGNTLDSDFVISVNSSKIQLGTKYLIPFTIESVSGSNSVIADNLKTGLRAIVVKNEYEGVYTSTGVRYNFNSAGDADISTMPPTGFVSSAPWTFETDILTVDGKTSTAHAGNSNGGFGTINIVVNNDNTVTIVPTADTGLNAVEALPGYTSTYDPAAKKFHLYYQYTNTTGTFRILDQTMVFLKDN